eukprot:TRINITY_DN2242_c0_g1_i2.p4 TRINITY_DN2242_c0_g1~~TRINITY_DN2242_c0_g1_i2.p4  ORF type:complete len:114 (+),score=61.41 TRINITY_DN2242_c0_g1_i2:83-424(+)
MPAKKPDAKKKAAPKKAGGKTSKGAKAKKKKWSKGKTREKLDNDVMWSKGALGKLESEVPKYKVITIAVVSERLKVNGSMARAALRHLEQKGAIKPVSVSAGIKVYTRATKDE